MSRYVGIIRHTNISFMKSIKSMIDLVIKYIRNTIDYKFNYLPDIRYNLTEIHNNYMSIMLEIVGKYSDLVVCMFSRITDIPMVMLGTGKKIYRRYCDEVIRRYKIFHLPVIKRAPSGGVTIWVLRYKGGQFLPQRIFGHGKDIEEKKNNEQKQPREQYSF